MKLLFVVNAPEFFLSHRLPLALAARAAGYEVHVATGPGAAVNDIVAQGFAFHPLPLTRSGLNPLRELRTVLAMHRLIRRLAPDVLHLVTIKPVLYGGLVARYLGVPKVVAAISGLGAVFVAESGPLVWLRHMVKSLYRLALGHGRVTVIFQNPDDRDLLIELGAVKASSTVLICGSGVDLAECPVMPEPAGVPVVVMAARLLRDKGVLEFVEAARLLRGRGIDGRFLLVGAPDPGNPASPRAEDVQSEVSAGCIEYLGPRTDVPAIFAGANLVVLPSYREGLPKVLAEASACARAVVTTDVPGCRDAIVVNETGLLVPVRDPVALAGAIGELLADPVRRRQMGLAGRRLAEQKFSVTQVVSAHLAIYRAAPLEGGG